jgi:hypothetical protein
MDLTMNAAAHAATATTSTTAPVAATSTSPGRAARWTGRIMSGLVVAFMAFDAAMKLARLPLVIKGTVELGYPVSSIVPMGIILLTCVVLYLIPRTAILGAVLLTGYLGGAIATHVRVGNPLFTHVLAPIYVAAFVWAGLYLRDARARVLLARRGS